MQNIYFFLNKSWSNTLNNRYIYKNNKTIVYLFAKKKKIDFFKTQATSYICFKYKKKLY